MSKTPICLALLAALSLSQTVAAEDSFDPRWYGSIGLGFANLDSDRRVDDDFFGTLGFGRFVAPRWSIDAELFYVNPEKRLAELNWSMYGLSAVGRYHFKDEGEAWWPYVALGVGAQRHEDEYSAGVRGPVDRRDTNLLASFAGGLQADYPRFAMRTELGVRFDMDDDTPGPHDNFKDIVAGVTLIYKFGAASEPLRESEPEVAPGPAAPAPTGCADRDADGDGVNDCEDKCSDSKPGQAVGADGCPVPLTLDLRGVNFDFDRSELRPDAIGILDEAVSILAKYPDLKVEVAGHTDAKGSDAYNQSLSERRARAVYDYLASKGIATTRLAGPNGYGESRPIAPNDNADGSDNPDGRAKNRRTELNVEN